jgi:hypothetical protein
MFYNARWLDVSLGRFTQADTIIPPNQGVQAWDRYAYTSNNPVLYTDPSGHGVDCGIGTGCVRDYSKAKTFKDFRDLSWKERKLWLKEFVEGNDLGEWFNDIGGAIDYMAADEYFSKNDSTAEVMDAAVLQAIYDGWLIHTGRNPVGAGGQGWASFFNLLKPIDGSPSTASQQQLNIARLEAEQKGVDYAFSLSGVQSAISNASVYEQIYFADFKYWADSYRTLGINGAGICPICAGNIDPRRTGDDLVFLSNFLPLEANFEYSWFLYSQVGPIPYAP